MATPTSPRTHTPAPSASAPWVWDRPEDGVLYQEAVRGLPTGDDAEFHTRPVVERVLTAGFGEYYDYQDAVERHDIATAENEGARSPGRRLLLRVWLATLRLQVAFMRRQWRKSLPAALSSLVPASGAARGDT
ncbi:hypothetical protein [Streptomyces aureocirculatus]|uniref:hypothetical protein n=1 Tax=Streptomyces aureocirculatus TaxID=67275 RepID=UPI0004C5FB96|nr:hypothetical protein [Streptomyces aureocirculatus]